MELEVGPGLEKATPVPLPKPLSSQANEALSGRIPIGLIRKWALR